MVSICIELTDKSVVEIYTSENRRCLFLKNLLDSFLRNMIIYCILMVLHGCRIIQSTEIESLSTFNIPEVLDGKPQSILQGQTREF